MSASRVGISPFDGRVLVGTIIPSLSPAPYRCWAQGWVSMAPWVPATPFGCPLDPGPTGRPEPMQRQRDLHTHDLHINARTKKRKRKKSNCRVWVVQFFLVSEELVGRVCLNVPPQGI